LVPRAGLWRRSESTPGELPTLRQCRRIQALIVSASILESMEEFEIVPLHACLGTEDLVRIVDSLDAPTPG